MCKDNDMLHSSIMHIIKLMLSKLCMRLPRAHSKSTKCASN